MSPSPLDLRGPEFLLIYLGLFAAALVMGFLGGRARLEPGEVFSLISY